VAWGQSLLLGHQVTMSGETVWQGLAAILPIFHWTVLYLTPKNQVWYPRNYGVSAEISAHLTFDKSAACEIRSTVLVARGSAKNLRRARRVQTLVEQGRWRRYNSCCESLSWLSSIGKSRGNPSKGAYLQGLTF
jgi:hypothetical protein